MLLLLQSSDRIAHDISEAHPASCDLRSGGGGGPAGGSAAEASEGAGDAGLGSKADSAADGGAVQGTGVPLTLEIRMLSLSWDVAMSRGWE